MDNARLIAEAGAAEMIPSNELSADRLAARLEELLADGSRLAAMGRAARGPGASRAPSPTSPTGSKDCEGAR